MAGSRMPPESSTKILSPEHAARWVKSFQKNGRKVVFTNGCFDLLHSGHVTYLEEARTLGDGLIIALNSDAAVKRLKGPDRPLVSLKDRARVIASLECVTIVTWFNADTPEKIIRKLSPKILVKGGDWPVEKIIGADHVLSHGGEVRSLQYIGGKSTTNLIEKAPQQRMTPQRAKELAEQLLKGDRKALARLITLTENREEHSEISLAKIYAHTGRAQLLGITGPPGAGKSTLTDKLVREARSKGKKVGVICVDPSSPFSGGAILGDRIRMQEHATDSDVFIRSLGTRGGQGGLSRATQEVAMLLDAAGFDLIILETAGVGQTELGILAVAQTIVVVLVPESGDDIQMMKAGILEIADILVVNKCDRQGSDHVVKELSAMLELGFAGAPWAIPVLKTSADRGDGVKEVFQKALDHYDYLHNSNAIAKRQFRFAQTAVLNLVRDMAADSAQALLNQPEGLELLGEVINRTSDPFAVAQKLLQRS